ncbi:MAG: hypothetical protein EOM15_11610 [Spirochaetia bacterium]|nr:hypothetical protein [Spirochaetia bacterium]
MKSIIAYLESEETKKSILKILQENLPLYQNFNTEDKIQNLTGSLYNYLVKECVQNNQYVSLSKETTDAINSIYRDLVLQLHNLVLEGKASQQSLEKVVQLHRENLISVLQHNSYNKNDGQVTIPCSEYSGSFQYTLLHLEDIVLKEPILDVGCGKQHQLLTYLQEKGYTELNGLDQYHSDEPCILCGNWLEFQFKPASWGTIIAHMSFSNHFRRSLMNQDSEIVLYMDTYHHLLDSLICGGCFIYSPAVKDIERALDPKRYCVTYFPNSEDRTLDTVCVQKRA